MKYKSIEKVHQGKFISRYNIEYETVSGRGKTYEMISRNPNITNYDELRGGRVDAVVMILHDESGEQKERFLHFLFC